MSSNINEYVGKTFSYILNTNILVIVHVEAFVREDEEFDGHTYLGDSYVGKCTVIYGNGESSTATRWSHEKESFEKLDKIRIR